MSRGDIVREIVESQIFGNFGINATLKKKQSNYNSRGERTDSTYGSGTTIEIVPYRFFQDRQELTAMGNLDSGDANFAVKYDVDVSEDDRIDFDGETYEVVNIEKSYLEKDVIQVLEVTKESNP